MEFGENNRISHRQLFRQILLTGLAPFLLCLPGKEDIQGLSGLVGIGFGIIFVCFYVIFLIRLTPWFQDLKKSAGDITGRLTGAFFLVYIILTAAYLLSVLVEIVPESLVTDMPQRWSVLLALLVCSIGAHRGMQRRGRMAEVSAGILMAGVLLLLIIGAAQGKWEYLSTVPSGGLLQGKTVIRHTYVLLCAFSGMGLLPFSLADVHRSGSAGKPVILAILTLGGLLFGTMLILPAVFGWERVAADDFPVLLLLLSAKLPGNIVARFDVIWLGLLVYGLLFAVGSMLHYGHQIVRSAHMGSGRIWIPALVFIVIFLRVENRGIQDYFLQYLEMVFLPGMLILQAFLLMKCSGQKRKKKVVLGSIAGAVCMVLGLSGCAGVEPEKRMYPLALGVDLTKAGEFSITYGMPSLPQAEGQEKTEKGNEVLTITGKTFSEIEKKYDRTQEKYLDMGHLQVLVMGQDILEENRWKDVLKYLRKDSYVGENIYVFTGKNVKKIIGWQGNQGSSLGEYLQGLLENHPEENKSQVPTLRTLYYVWSKEEEITRLPEIVIEGDMLTIQHY